MDLGLSERVALVTGSSRGIGSAIAQAFGREGARVAVTYRTDRQRADDVACAIRRAGGDAMVVFFDLASPASILDAVAAVRASWGRLDVLVNNAFMWPNNVDFSAGRAPSLTPEWQALLRANVEGVMAATDAAVPAMIDGRWGRIVNISSVWAVDGMRGFGGYTAAKAALHGWTQTLAKELGSDGILANVVMPGMTLTERVRAYFPRGVQQQNARAVAVGRLLEPAEVAAMVVFLGSAANTAVTGEVIRVSGGRM